MNGAEDPEMAALNERIGRTLSFFGSKFSYSPHEKEPYKGQVFSREDTGSVVYTLMLGVDDHDLCVIGIRPENGYRNPAMERALLSTGIGVDI